MPTIRSSHCPQRPAMGWLSVLWLALLCLPLTAADRPPRQIVLDASPPPTLDSTERLAVDRALIAGAAEIGTPYRLTTTGKVFEQEFGVQPGRCYFMGVAFTAHVGLHFTYVFGLSADGMPISEGVSQGHFHAMPPSGSGRFCTDRAGTVTVRGAQDGPPDTSRPVEYVLVVGWRPETNEQADARRRCVTTAREDC